jgi:hypothetical protein
MKNARLSAVNKAKQAYVMAKTTLEQRLREQMREELSNLQTQIDIAVRFAYESGESKASILRALGTKDYGTLNGSLERTSGVTEVVGDDPYNQIFTMMDSETVVVSYDRHGPSGYSGEASFTVKKLDDGSYLFLSLDPLWSDDYRTRNDVVAVLDGVKDGFYYEELMEWIHQTG